MKRILSLVLILVMAVSLFAACGEQPTNPTVAGATVEDAKTYLYAMYKDDDGTIARRDFSVVGAVMIDGVSFPIEWTTDSPDYVTIGAAEKNMVKIDIVEEPAEQVTFKLIATLKDAAGNTASVTITRVIEAAKVTGVEFVAAPAVDTAYKYAVTQNNLGQTLYFTGEMSGYYLATSINPYDGVDVYVENVEGGQRLYFNNAEGVKTYIDVVARGEDQPGKVNVVLTDAPTCVYTWDAERKTFVTNTVADNTWYLGCYSSYNTISASNVSYIEDVTKIGDSQFPAGLCNVSVVPSQVAAPAADTAYKFVVQQNTLGKTLYFTGEMSGYYLATSENPGHGVNIFVENVEGGARLYFMKGEAKVYIDVIPRGEDQPGKVNITLTEAPTCVYTWDADRKTYTTTVADNTWYLGCYSSYNTISASNVSYIENMDVIGESQFPAGPYIVEGFMELQPDLNKHVHTEAEAVKENEKAATCTEAGSYESVVYCSECKEEVSRTTKTVDATGHAQAEPVQENVVGGGCGEAGSYESVVYCSVCNAEVSRTLVEIPATGDHNYITELERKDATCTEAGYVKKACSCGAETTEELPAAHTEAEAVKENEVAASLAGNGGYDSVVYCTVCGAEVSREAVTVVGGIQTGVAYKAYVNQKNVGQVLYFVGTTANKDYYMSTSENINDAIDVYFEEVEGGYRIYFMVGETKTYLDAYVSGTYYNARLTDAPTAVFVVDAEYNTLVATMEDGTAVYFGAYNSYTTLSVSKASYLGGSSNFVLEFVLA